MVLAFIGPSEERRKALTAAGQPLPPPVSIRALVDTGASNTCVDPTVLTDLGLSPTGRTTVLTAGGAPEDRDQYDVWLAIPGSDRTAPPLLIPTIAVIATPLLDLQGFHALIGRDILERCLLHYNGSLKTFTLAY